MKHLQTTGLTFFLALFLSLNLSGCIFGLGGSDEDLEPAATEETRNI